MGFQTSGEAIKQRVLEAVEYLLEQWEGERVAKEVEKLTKRFPITQLPVEEQAQLWLTIGQMIYPLTIWGAYRAVEQAFLLYPLQRADRLALEIAHRFAIIAGERGLYSEARNILVETLRCAAQIGDIAMCVGCAVSLSRIYIYYRQWEAALQVLDYAEGMLQCCMGELMPEQVQRWRVVILQNRAAVYGEKKDFSTAFQVLLQIDQQQASPVQRAVVLMNIGICLENLGALEEALKYYEAAQDAFQGVEGEKLHRARLLINLSALFIRVQRYQEAEKVGVLAYDIACDIGDEELVARALVNRTNAALGAKDQNQLSALVPLLQQTLETVRSPVFQIELLLSLAGALVALEQLSEAEKLATYAATLAENRQERELYAEALIVLADIKAKAGEHDLVRQYLDRAQAVVLPGEDLELKIRLLQQQRSYAESMEDWEKAYRYLQQQHALEMERLQLQWQDKVAVLQHQLQLEVVSKQAERLQKLNARLEKLSAEKDLIIRMLSHDLRNVLSQMTIALSLIDPDQPMRSESNQAVFDVLQQSIDFLSFLGEEYLTLLLLRDGALTPAISPCHCRDIVQETITVLMPQLRSKQQVLEQELESFQIHTDAKWMRQIALNLLSNAIKYTPRKGQIAVKLQARDQGALLVVRDTGVGIPEDELEKIFQPFVKATPTPTEGERSTGLGLTIVKLLVETLGGKISVESTVGKGTTFQVWIPDRRSEAQRATTQ